METNALRHVPVGTVFQLDSAPPHFFRYVRSFLEQEFPNCWIGRREPIPWTPRSLDLTSSGIFFLFWGVCKAHYGKKKQNVSCATELESALLMKCLPVSSERLNIILMCVVPLMVTIKRRTGHIRNFVMSSV